MTAESLIEALRERGLWFTETAPGCFEHHSGGPYIRILVAEQAIGMFTAYGTDSPTPGVVMPVRETSVDELVRFLGIAKEAQQ